MLQAEGDKADAVYCGTPDHTHAIVTLAALRRRKHVCCVKPLTRTVEECRAVVAESAKAKVATQVTAAPNTNEWACRTCELIWAGAIGPVREVHVWSDRPLWPQGMVRPAGADPIPNDLDWDLWLGPAPKRPFKANWPDGDIALRQVNMPGGSDPWYRSVYHPFNFRGWWDFGTGALGDMGCHYLNTPFKALKLTSPTHVHATSTRLMGESAPLASVVTFEFPEREGMPPLRMVWYDGGLRPPVPRQMIGRSLGEGGAIFIGDEGAMIGPNVIPAERGRKFETTPKTLQRRSGTFGEWLEACKGGPAAGCAFEWAGPLTECILLGNIAIRRGKPLDWDGPGMRFTNDADANRLLSADYQNGWSLKEG
jgi:predicted dehydrogenase